MNKREDACGGDGPLQEGFTAERVTNLMFQDFEARSNIVGLYDLALKAAKRNPKLWAKIVDLPSQEL